MRNVCYIWGCSHNPSWAPACISPDLVLHPSAFDFFFFVPAHRCFGLVPVRIIKKQFIKSNVCNCRMHFKFLSNQSKLKMRHEFECGTSPYAHHLVHQLGQDRGLVWCPVWHIELIITHWLYDKNCCTQSLLGSDWSLLCTLGCSGQPHQRNPETKWVCEMNE